MALSLDQHPQLPQVLDWIALGKSDSWIAKKLQPRLDPTTIWRYRKRRMQAETNPAANVVDILKSKNLISETASVSDLTHAIESATVPSLQADPIRARLARHRDTIDASLAAADDGKTVAALVGVDLKGLELDARLTGRLDAPTVQVVNMVMVPASEALASMQPQAIDITAEVVTPPAGGGDAIDAEFE